MDDSSESSESDADFDYLSHLGGYNQIVNSLAAHVIKDLFINNKLNKSQYIQKSSEDVNQVKISHIVLNDNQIHEFTNSSDIFQSKLKVLQDLELKLKQKSIYHENDGKKLTKSDVEINSIPKSFEDFLKIVFDLNACVIEDEKSQLYFREETQYRNIQYKDHDSYVKAFIPFVFRELWSSLKNYRKRQLSTHLMDHKVMEENKIKCTHIRNNSWTECKFKFGQIVVLNYLIDSNLTAKDSEHKLFFGIVQSVESKLIDKTSDPFLNLSESQSQETDFILDEITIFCNPCEQKCEKVSVMALNCVQKYLLMARIVYELKERFPQIFKQILKPIFTFGVSGISINMETRNHLNFFDDQLDSIQKAYEVCCASDSVYSSFVAIYGTKKSGKTEILRESILQLLKYGETKVSRLLVISKSESEITSIIEQMKRHKIKVYHIDSEGKCISHNKIEIRDKIIKLNKELLFEEIVEKDTDSYERCLKFYNEDIEWADMSTKEKFMKEQIEKKVVCRLIFESQVIIGSIDSICNDEPFNFTFNFVQQNVITSVLIDNASIYTEPEILTLLYSGVKGIVLLGDTHENAKSYEKCESFLQRYVRLYNSTNSNEIKSGSTSVVKLRDSIESRNRYTSNQNFKQCYNNKKTHFRYYNSNKYSTNKNRSFKNYNIKGRKNSFHKYRDQKHSIQRLNYPNSDQTNPRPLPKHESQITLDSSLYNTNRSEYLNNNVMTDQLLQSSSHVTAYGNRESYLLPSNDYNELNNNLMSVQSYGNRAPHYTHETNFQFMANPSLDANQSYRLE